MLQVENRRKSFRMPFVSRYDCWIEGQDERLHGTLRDVSMKGLFGEIAGSVTNGRKCCVKIYFEGDHSRLIVENVYGKIVRIEGEGVAIEFDKRLEWFVLIPLFFQKVSGKTVGTMEGVGVTG